MNPDTAANLLSIFVLGLFIGTNLGVLLMCLLRIASPDPPGENPPPLEPRPRPDRPTPAPPPKEP